MVTLFFTLLGFGINSRYSYFSLHICIAWVNLLICICMMSVKPIGRIQLETCTS